jgi:Porin subfamily
VAGLPGNNTSFLLGGQNTDTGVNNIQYTAQFGNGVSASIGLDDPTVWDRTSLYNLSTGLNAAGVTGNAYGGVQSPDVVGNIRIDQAWGLFQISAAAHEVNGSYNILTATTAAPTNLSEISGHPETKWGGSAMAALNIKNIPTGAGDDIKVDVSYAKGDTKNVIATSSTSPSFAHVRQHRPRVSKYRLRCDHRRRLPSRHDQWNRAHGCLWRSRRVQPQLGSVLVVEPLRLGVLCAV